MTDAVQTSVATTPQSWTELLASAPQWAREESAAAILQAHWRARYASQTASEYLSVLADYPTFDEYLQAASAADGGTVEEIRALATPAPTAGSAEQPTVEAQYTEADETKGLNGWKRCSKNASANHLEQGAAGLLYVRARMSLHPETSREVCVKTLRATAEEHSDKPVDLNRIDEILQHAATWELLSPYAPPKYRKPGTVAIRVVAQWSRLCTRDSKSRAERWTLPLGCEAKIGEEYGKSVAAEHTSAEARDVVNRIIAERLTTLREAAEKAWMADNCTRTAIDLTAARKAEIAAWKGAGKPAPTPGEPALSHCKSAGIEPAPEAQEGTQTGDKDTKGTKGDKSNDKGSKGTPETANGQSDAGIPPLDTLMKGARASGNQARAVADYCVELIRRCDEPDTAADLLAQLLSACGDLHKDVREGFKAATEWLADAGWTDDEQPAKKSA